MKVRNRRLTVNPFKSQAQRALCRAGGMGDVDCDEWEEATPDKKLPAHVANAKRRRKGKRNPLKLDPTRTITLRRAFTADLRRRFARLRFELRKLVIDEDAFGLVKDRETFSFNSFCPTGEGGGIDPSCSPGSGGGVPGGYAAKMREVTEKATAIIDRVPGAKVLRERVAGITKRLTDRYGAKQAAAIVASGQAFGWGLSIGGTALTGVPVYVPFSTVIGMVPGMLLAEAVRHLGKMTTNETELTDEEVAKLGRELVEEVVRACGGVTVNAGGRFAFASSPQKVAAFRAWLGQQLRDRVLGHTEDELWAKYVEQGFKKGAGRAFEDVNRKERVKHGGNQRLDFYAGTKEQFLKSAFGRPETKEKVQLLVSRNYHELKGVTDEMGKRMSRTLADGLVQGKNPRDVARDLDDALDLGRTRSEVIARTEIIRAHAEGQLDALEDLGVEELNVMVEWSTAGDELVCPLCESLEGVVLTIEEAHGMLPRHPNCRCAWVPANVGESPLGQTRTKGGIEDAFEGAGVDISVGRDRPRSLVGNLDALDRFSRFLANAFCPTGPGGGIDPTCSPGGAAAAAPVHAGTGIAIGSTYTKTWKGQDYKLEVTTAGFKVTSPDGSENTYKSPSAAARAVVRATSSRQSSVHGWLFFGIPRTAGAAQPAAPKVPSPSHAASHPVVPFKDEIVWSTGKPQPGVLNGVPFAPAPPKFWEKTKDADIKEPPPLRHIDRVSVMVKEDDGRVWIVQPTGQFGSRKYTMPGGGVEKGLTNQQNALKEVWEETGLHVEITGHLGDFEDSNNGKNGRLYVGRRIGGAPWDAKIEPHITDPRTGRPAAESEAVNLVTLDKASELLHRTDDLAQLATVRPIKLETKVDGNMMNKLVAGVQPVANAYLDRMTQKGAKAGNHMLHAVQEMRGFNGKPQLVSKQDMDDLIAKGQHIDLLRGVRGHGATSGKVIAEQFRSGDHYPGFGVFGSGTYADSNRGPYNVALSQYGGGRNAGAIRMALPKDAKIIDASELERKVPDAPKGFRNVHFSGGHSKAECWLGVHAALAGYDAIRVDGNSGRHGNYGKGFYVILNRSKVIVQKQDAKGHVIR